MPNDTRRGAGLTALVTGSSSGIGRELARLLAADGFDLVLTARNAAALDELARELSARHSVSVRGIADDLADPAAPQRLFQTVQRVDVLVNNAGFGTHGDFAASDLEAELRMVQVNVSALLALTRLFLPGMIERRAGWIMQVASLAAFVPGTHMSVYYASKAFVLSHALALRQELQGTGVVISALCPGPTTTDFQRRAGIREQASSHARVLSAAEVAQTGYRGLWRGQSVVVPGWGNRFSAFATRFLPRQMQAQITAKLNRDRKLG